MIILATGFRAQTPLWPIEIVGTQSSIREAWAGNNPRAHLGTGNLRRRSAPEMVNDVTQAVAGDVPHRPTYFPPPEEFVAWLEDFPNYAQRNKSAKKTREGVSLADMSIVKEWERTCRLHSMRTVRIWSLDGDLQGYSREVNR